MHGAARMRVGWAVLLAWTHAGWVVRGQLLSGAGAARANCAGRGCACDGLLVCGGEAVRGACLARDDRDIADDELGVAVRLCSR